MNRTFFEETQTYRQASWLLMTAISSSVFVVGLLLYGIYLQLIMGEQWGDKPMSDVQLVIVSILSFGIIGLVIWLLINTRLEVKIDANEIHYRFYPHMNKWQTLTPAEIDEYETVRLGFFERGERGYRGIFKSNKKLIILGRNALKIKTRDGRKIIIGTQSPEELDWAMKKLMTKPETGL